MNDHGIFKVELVPAEQDMVKELIKDRILMVEAAIAIEDWRGDEHIEDLRNQNEVLQNLYLKFA